ncbi:MAG: 3-hydroxyacyl-CoA dehydrogenase [Candidatus Eremiobacteraeota bacterium]|nr:3-hydroxyacyl-CoA dehydrogenase [Candidatus Eremiobacteraeota bacterium]
MQRIAVVGAGTMGAGIALCAAAAGLDVDLVEVDAAMRERASERLKQDAGRLKREDALTRIQMWSTIAQIGPADLAIEAVPEVLTLKQRVFTELERQLSDSAILATNTSSLSVGEIADVLENPTRTIGLHFFNPPTVMKLVEVVRAATSDAAVVEIGRAFAESLGKIPVVTADTPGFIVNRVARPFYLQALRALDAGAGEVEDLDFLARGAGFRMGPFELMDLIGIDINLATTLSIYDRTQAPRFAPVQRQQEMVAQKMLGRKTGEGFYQYEDGRPIERTPIASPEPTLRNDDESIVVLGFGDIADAIVSGLRRTYANVKHIQTDMGPDDAFDQLDVQPSIVFDIGDGTSDRSAVLAAIENAISDDAVIFVDAYATPMRSIAQRLENPEFVVGYGIVGSLERQAVVEIVDAQETDDDALALAEELFAALGKRTMLIGDVPGLFLGRMVASIVNEAVYAVQEGVANAGDIDSAMQLGTNYPLGPIAWGKEIGADRVGRILAHVAEADGKEFGPARALWALDADAEAVEQMSEERIRQDRSAYGPGGV